MKKATVVLALFIACLSGMALSKQRRAIGAEATLHYFSTQTQAFIASLSQLKTSIQNISATDKQTVVQARRQLAATRLVYKRLEFFIPYFFEGRIAIFNGAPVYEVEEPYMEYQTPVGLQVMEGLLFDEAAEKKEALLAQADLMLTTANGLSQFLYGRHITDEEIMESLRLQVVRIIALGITGYDAPQLKTGIAEARESLLSLQQNLTPYLAASSPQTSEVITVHLQQCIAFLSAPASFNSFNRLGFLTAGALPLQAALQKLTSELRLGKKGDGVLNSTALNLFSKTALQQAALSGNDTYADTALIALGRKLFFEKALSGNHRRSCATCHQPQRYFTDGLAKSVAFNGHDNVRRNAPSVLYAAYQTSQFWDGRSPGLEAQIQQVLLSHTEMNAGDANLVTALQKNAAYQPLFAHSFSASDSLFSITNIAKAIAAFEASLPIMTSAFDEYIAGNKQALSARQKQGFNLFMGKAQCGTCHFAPLFNSLLPPLYNRSEIESLGMTATTDFKKPIADKDSGHYEVQPIRFFAGLFKTPTVRNCAKTAPYMHNGAFKTLAQVIDFYDGGGGAGFGLSDPYQTLSAKPLHLTTKEKAALISFLEALTDEPVRE